MLKSFVDYDQQHRPVLRAHDDGKARIRAAAAAHLNPSALVLNNADQLQPSAGAISIHRHCQIWPVPNPMRGEKTVCII